MIQPFLIRRTLFPQNSTYKVIIKGDEKNLNEKLTIVQCYEYSGNDHYDNKYANQRNIKGKTMQVAWVVSDNFDDKRYDKDSNNFITFTIQLVPLILLTSLF